MDVEEAIGSSRRAAPEIHLGLPPLDRAFGRRVRLAFVLAVLLPIIEINQLAR